MENIEDCQTSWITSSQIRFIPSDIKRWRENKEKKLNEGFYLDNGSIENDGVDSYIGDDFNAVKVIDWKVAHYTTKPMMHTIIIVYKVELHPTY
jgi:hypothetical protein